MKPNYLVRFKAKYPAVNFSQKRMDALSAALDGMNLTDDASIDTALDALNGSFFSFADIAKQDDIERDLQGKLKKAAPPKKEEKIDPPVDPPPPADDTPAWAKALMQEVQTLKAEKTQNTIKEKATGLLKDKVPVSYWEEFAIPEKEEDLPGFAERVTTKFNAFVQEQTDKGLSGMGQPRSAAGGPAGEKKATPDQVKAVVDNIMN